MIALQRGRIDVGAVIGAVRREDAGAVVVFLGTVRSDPGVESLDYEVYEGMALKKLHELADRSKEKFGVKEMAVVHRLGKIPVGEDSVVIACSAPHRKGAFAACAWAMEEVKRIVPIWKSMKPQVSEAPGRA